MDHTHALTHLAAVLAATFIGGALFRKLKQPVLVGYIIVGLVLGPSILGVVESREEVALLAELGILLLLFIVGMEIDLKSFKAVSKISLVTCCVQIGVGLAAMLILGAIFDWPLNRSILLGFAISLSSTAVALKILEEMKLRETTVGRTSVGILVGQDLAFIPMVLIIGALNTGEGFNYDGLIRLGLAIVFMVGLMFLLTKKPKIFQIIWKKFESVKIDAMKGQVAITALAFCFSAAAISGILGISPAYGAFVAGIILGHTMSHKELESHTKPIFDVTIMVFFLSIGLLIDLEFLKNNIVATLSLLFITMLIKTVVNFFVLRFQGMPKEEAYVTGASLAQVGEFSFVLAAIGLSAGTIESDSYKYVVAIISLSLLATPLWLYLVEKRGLLKHLNVVKAVKRGRTTKKKELDA
jgi:CPA2 family monovalent cation:H+ antiporter-2